jgi:hypothetical protein
MNDKVYTSNDFFFSQFFVFFWLKLTLDSILKTSVKVTMYNAINEAGNQKYSTDIKI